jgi:hypothetical protein
MIVRVRLQFYFVEVEPIDRIFRKADFPGRISYDDADAFVPTSVPRLFQHYPSNADLNLAAYKPPARNFDGTAR